MARVTVDDCLSHDENRFSLVVLAAQRTRQIMRGAPALVESENRPAVTALREIATGRVHWNRSSESAIVEYIAERKAADR